MASLPGKLEERLFPGENIAYRAGWRALAMSGASAAVPPTSLSASEMKTGSLTQQILQLTRIH